MKNQGRLIRPQFEAAFTAKFGTRELKYVGFEKSLEALDILSSGSHNAKISSEIMSKIEFSKLLTNLFNQIDNRIVLLFFPHYENIGAIYFSLENIIQNVFDLIEIDGNSIFALEIDGTGGIDLDFDNNSLKCSWGYDVHLMGSWASKYGKLI